MFLNLLIDLILVLILVIGSYYGYTRGLFRMLARPMRFALCLAVAFWLCRPIGEAIISPLIEVPIESYISDFVYDKLLGLDPEQAIDEIPTLLKISAAAFNIGLDPTAETIGDATEKIIASLSLSLVKLISTAIAFLGLLLLSRLVSKLLVELLDYVVNFGLLGSINRILGVLLSCVFGFLIAWLIVGGLDFLFHSSLFAGASEVENFEGGPIYTLFLRFSLIRLLFSF